VLRLGVGVDGLVGNDRVTGVRLVDGSVLPADMVVVGIGARPAVDWLQGSGVPVRDGVICRADLTVADRVVAVGDVARWQQKHGGDLRIEHWDNAVRQADAAAATLLDPGAGAPYTATSMFWSDQYDCKLHLVGHPAAGDDFVVLEGSPDDRRFVGAYMSGDRLHAVLLCNQPHRLRTYRTAVEDGALPAPVEHHRAVSA
jgi:NADPH-dependent 2,4-dienoyl-CoA reductase/sulfur reductase-like enzyme